MILLADVVAIWWAMGNPKRVPRAMMVWLHYLVWIGLLIMIASGLVMFSTYQSYLLTLPTFYLKMSFVTALVLNGVFIQQHYLVATLREFCSLEISERWPLFISGIVSFLGWCGAALCGLLLFA